MKICCCITLFLGMTVIYPAFGQQEDLLSLIEEDEPAINYATASFKTNRVINLHSLENTARGVLDFKISHRFNTIDEGFYDLFGLDGATIRLGLDYGVSGSVQIGIGRSTLNKTYDGYVKYKILRQSTGKVNMPLTLSGLASIAINTLRWQESDRENFFSHRLSYTYQLIAGRKFSENFSLQLSPTLVHRNLVKTVAEANDVFALGIGLRQKIARRIAINFEYVYVPDGQLAARFANAMSLGLDIETGGHVFQLHFTNARGMFEEAFITKTIDTWDTLGIRFGFNISRVFTIVR